MAPEEEKDKAKQGKDSFLSDRWLKKRIFVRELAGKYGEIYRDLLEQPRVFKSRNMPWKGGPTFFHKSVINPQSASITQTIETHVDVLAPGGYGQKHCHMNSAVMYVLEGKGHDVHGGVRHDWEAGDAAIVENACVHQHFNDDESRPTRYVIFKAKPLFLFFNLLHQMNITYPPAEPQQGWENFYPDN